MERWSIFAFGPPIRRGGLWAKHMGLKRGAIGNTLWAHIENLMGTHWELDRNMLGTTEKRKENPALQRIIMNQSDYQFCNLVYLCCHSIPLKFNNYV
jgi:hypothetical protein